MDDPRITPTKSIAGITANVDAIEKAERAKGAPQTKETIKQQSDDIYRKALKPDNIIARAKAYHKELADKSKAEIDELILSTELQLQIIRDAQNTMAENSKLQAKHQGIIAAAEAFIAEAKKHE